MIENVNVQVRSTFSPDQEGTQISFDIDENQAKAVTGVAYSKDEAKITIIDLVDQLINQIDYCYLCLIF